MTRTSGNQKSLAVWYSSFLLDILIKRYGNWYYDIARINQKDEHIWRNIFKRKSLVPKLSSSKRSREERPFVSIRCKFGHLFCVPTQKTGPSKWTYQSFKYMDHKFLGPDMAPKRLRHIPRSLAFPSGQNLWQVAVHGQQLSTKKTANIIAKKVQTSSHWNSIKMKPYLILQLEFVEVSSCHHESAWHLGNSLETCPRWRLRPEESTFFAMGAVLRVCPTRQAGFIGF